jgi:hypothetical protein
MATKRKTKEEPIPHVVTGPLHEGFAGWCVNYQSIVENTHCKAGIAYAEVTEKKPYTYSVKGKSQKFKRPQVRPCFRREAPLAKPCEHCRFPLPAEIEKHKVEGNTIVSKILRAQAAISLALELEEMTPNPRIVRMAHAIAGDIKCPICGGVLSFSVPLPLSRIAAACDGEGCVRWRGSLIKP